MTGCTFRRYEQLDTSPETIEQELRKEPMVLADDVVLCGGISIDMTEYLESWRKALEESDDQQRSGCM